MSAEKPTEKSTGMPADGLARRLLDAQVAHHLQRLEGEELERTVTDLVAAALARVGDRPLGDVVDAETVKAAVGRALVVTPGRAGEAGPLVGALAEALRDVVRRGPAEPFALADVVDRTQVEAVVDALLGLTPALERGLDRLAESPLVGTMATQFMARVMGEVMNANQAVANRVPGLGSLFSLGVTAATGMAGAADKQLEALLGGTVGGTVGGAVGKGSSLAARRLNAILVDTLRDPTTRAALLQVWDVLAAQPIGGADRTETQTAAKDPTGDGADTVERAAELADALRDLVVSTLAHPRTLSVAHSVVDAFFERHAATTLTDVLAAAGLDREDLAAAAVGHVPALVETARESGALERWLRARLEPFYASDEVAALLAGD